jgi:hypothetical protein
VLLVIAAVLCTGPVLEMGLNDDWSFAFIARGLARGGHIAYNGWAAPLLGLQALWGGWLIGVFGFSFTLLRLSTLPFAAGCAWLLYLLGRRTGLNHWLAAFGALAVALSPVFIPLAASYMTDVPALFFWMACFYCAVRALSAGDATPSAVWLAAAAAAGFAGGTIRQVVWAAPFLVLPAAAWLRGDRRLAVAAGLLCCATAAAAAVCLRWYQAQAGHEPVPVQPWTAVLPGLAEPVRMMIVAGLLAILPVLLLYLSGWKRWRRAPAAPLLGSLAAGALLAACLWWCQDDLLLGNMVTANGVLWEGSEAMGARPEVLGVPVLAALGTALCLGAGFAAAWLFNAWRHRAEWAESSTPLRRFLFLTAPSCALYVLAVAFRYTSDGILFDRYLIFVTPPLVISLLWLYQQRIAPSPTRLAWAVLALFAVYGVANAHDYVAAARARLHAASRVMASGVPRTRVSAGLEFDGWTQLECTGRIPSRAERERDSRTFPVPDPYWFWRMTPAVDPLYFVVYSPVEGLRDSTFAPIVYHAWLPPFHRQVLTQTLP